MRFAYICSKYAGDVLTNVFNAKLFSQKVFSEGFMPVCVHIFLNDVTGLAEEKDRFFLLELGKVWIRRCDLVIVNSSNGISDGMRQEIAFAEKLGIEVVYDENFKNLGQVS